MKIYFNRMPVGGPWGGGSKILRAIMIAFSQRGYTVTDKLTNDVNVIFCFDPRSSQDSGSLSYKEIENWKKNNPKVIVVQRVGDVGTHGKPELTELVLDSVVKSDVVIYPSNWAMQFILDNLFEKGIRVNKQFHIIDSLAVRTCLDDLTNQSLNILGTDNFTCNECVVEPSNMAPYISAELYFKHN